MLDPDLLADVQARVAKAEFVERVHRGVSPPSVDLCMVPDAAVALLELAFNDPAVAPAVETITRSGPNTPLGGLNGTRARSRGEHGPR